MKHRQSRINEDMKHHIAEIIRNLKDPRVPEIVSVVSVKVTPDLKYAKIYISTVVGGDSTKECLKALKNASGFIRREIGSRMQIRIVPELEFIYDDSIEHGIKISKILDELNITDGAAGDDE